MNSDFKFTNDEIKSFEDNMQKPEFKKLFFEYLNEISDPKNKALYEEEIIKMERQSGFDSILIKNVESECYLSGNYLFNICVGENIDRCEFHGQRVTIPLAISKGKEIDRDSVEKLLESKIVPVEGNKYIQIYNCSFHAETIKLGPKMLLDTVRDEMKKQNIELDEFNKLSVKSLGLESSILRSSKTKNVPEKIKNSIMKDIKPKEAVIQSKSVPKTKEIPKFKIVHQNIEDGYQGYTQERQKSFKRPDNLVITVYLPKTKKISEVTLDLSKSKLDLSSTAYKLHLDLPFEVNDEKASAQFVKGKSELCVSVPVIQKIE